MSEPTMTPIDKFFDTVKNNRIKQGIEIMRTLAVSTAHLKPETTEDLIERGNISDSQVFGPIIIYPKDAGAEGLFVKLDTDMIQSDKSSMDRFSEDLRAVLSVAMSHRCSIIEFDANAPEIASLTVYEWQ